MRPPDRGEVKLAGNRVSLASNRAAIEQGISYVSEDRLSLGLVLDQPISSNIVLAILEKLAGALGLVRADRRREAVRRMDRAARHQGVKPGEPGADAFGR